MKPERIQEPWTDELGWRLEQKSDGHDTVCHTYAFADPHEAFDFVTTLCQIATYVDQLNLLLEEREWQQPSDVLGAIERPHLAELAHVAAMRLRAHQQRNLRLAHVTQQLEMCLNRGKL